MKKKLLLQISVMLSALLLSGCAMRTIDELYAPPKRSEEYSRLQSAIDIAMAGLEYSAPLSGENQQAVQMADLDGDGVEEYLVFAKGKIKRDSVQMKKHYDQYLKYLKDNNLEIEFGKIHFIKKGKTNEYLDKLENPKREYLKELLNIDSKN